VARSVALSPDGDHLDLGCATRSAARRDHASSSNNSQAAADHNSANDSSANNCRANDDQHTASAQHIDNIHHFNPSDDHDGEFNDLDVDNFDVDYDYDYDYDSQSIVRLSANLPSSRPS
jgi:hypothetical protein